MKYLFIFLIILLACAEVKPIEEVLIEGIYDHAEYTQGYHGDATIIHFKDGQTVVMHWQQKIVCRTGDSIAVVKIGFGSSTRREIRIRRKGEKEAP